MAHMKLGAFGAERAEAAREAAAAATARATPIQGLYFDGRKDKTAVSSSTSVREGSHPKDVWCRFRAVPGFWGKFDISSRWAVEEEEGRVARRPSP